MTKVINGRNKLQNFCLQQLCQTRTAPPIDVAANYCTGTAAASPSEETLQEEEEGVGWDVESRRNRRMMCACAAFAKSESMSAAAA